jgi:hypothetical protein
MLANRKGGNINVKDISNVFNERSLPYWLTTVLATNTDTKAGIKRSRLQGRIGHKLRRLTEPPTSARLEESEVNARAKLAITKRLILPDASNSNETYTDIRLLAVHSANPPASSRARKGYLISVRLTRLLAFRCAGRPTTRYPLPLSSGPIEVSSRVVSSRRVITHRPSLVASRTEKPLTPRPQTPASLCSLVGRCWLTHFKATSNWE